MAIVRIDFSTTRTSAFGKAVMVLGNAVQLTPELIAEAEVLRAQLKDLPERLIRREVRDRLDNKARASIGPIASLGMDEVDEAVQR